jgi:hypothetical protein
MVKICTKCKIEKDLEEFHNHIRTKDGKTSMCKLCNKTKPKTKERAIFDTNNYKKRNPEKVKESFKKWYEKTKHIPRIRTDSTKEKQKIWVKDNKERLNELRKIRAKNPTIKQLITKKLRDRFYKAIIKMRTGKKFTSCMNLVGCDIDFLKTYIESQFTVGMDWSNHGNGENKWNIDHIRPLVTFDLYSLDDQKIAFHYLNLRPLWFAENMRRTRKKWTK